MCKLRMEHGTWNTARCKSNTASTYKQTNSEDSTKTIRVQVTSPLIVWIAQQTKISYAQRTDERRGEGGMRIEFHSTC